MFGYYRCHVHDTGKQRSEGIIYGKNRVLKQEPAFRIRMRRGQK